MRRVWTRALMVALVAAAAGAQETSPFASAVQGLLAQHADSSARPLERAALTRLYRSPALRPLWTDSRGAPTSQALTAIDLLAAAPARGLDSADYDVPTLRVLTRSAGRSLADQARFDVALSRAVTRFVADLHAGRVEPTRVRFDLPNAHDRVDLAALIGAIARASDVAGAIAQAEPPYAGYHALERALARYRSLAADTSLRALPRVVKAVRPGDRYAGVPELTRLLTALGDLEAAADTLSAPWDSLPVYGDELAEAVARFQLRHGLDADGVIGPATMRQLRVPLAQRVRQMELTLERWRWLPDRAPGRYVVVNIPAFRLYAFENDSSAQHPLLAMRVIVGQAEGRHDTPVFTGTMQEVIFRPYWEVPPRIARTELVPTFRRQREYFTTEGFEIVRDGAGDAPSAATFPPTPDNLNRLAAGELRVRQRPGPTNALGFVKFVFPNPYNVYLHGTPAQELFATTRRDYSHGCIRIAEPNDMAEWVLRGQTPWDRAAIDSAMTGTRTIHVPVARPVAVFVLYATVVVDAEGDVNFYPDLYRHDAALERVLGLPPVTPAR